MSLHYWALLISVLCFAAAQLQAYLSLRFHLKNFLFEVQNVRQYPTRLTNKELLGWLAPFIKVSGNATHISQAREIALNQLTEHLHAMFPFQKLLKFSVAAPLLGVVLTALGFVVYSGDLESIQSLAIPLVAGVAIGAILAIFNQILVYLSEKEMETARQAGQAVVDDVWVECLNTAGDPNRVFFSAAEKLDQTVTLFQQSIKGLPDDVAEFTEQFKAIQKLSQSAFSHLDEISPRLRYHLEIFENTTNSIFWLIDEQFRPAMANFSGGSEAFVKTQQSLQSSMELISSAIERMETITQEQKSVSSLMKQTMVDSSQNLEQTISSELQKISEFQENILTTVSQSITRLVDFMSAFNPSIEKHLKTIANGTTGIASPLECIKDQLNALIPVINETEQIIDRFQQLSEKIGSAVEQTLNPTMSQLESFRAFSDKMSDVMLKVSDQLKALEAAKDANDAFADLIKKRALPTADSLLRATGSFEDATHEIAESSRELAETISLLRKLTLEKMK
jgi:methyl-accepting chemotaxis protein